MKYKLLFAFCSVFIMIQTNGCLGMKRVFSWLGLETNAAPNKKQNIQGDSTSPATTSTRSATPMASETIDKRPLHILSAEDSALTQTIIRKMVIKKYPQCEIDFAPNGIECLKMFNEKPEGYYGLLFMDNQMPRQDGPTTVRLLKGKPLPENKKLEEEVTLTRTYRPQIIGITSCFLPFEQDEFRASGLDGLYIKASPEIELFKEMDRCLNDLSEKD
jgi:CheY-like chemotaxis protein